MAYCTIDDVAAASGGLTRLIQVADLDSDGSVDTAVVDGAIESAEVLVGSYARRRWRPGTVPRAVRDVTARIAARALRARTPWPDDERAEERDRLWLVALSRGEVTVVDESAEESELVADEVGTRESTRDLTRAKTRGVLW